MSNEAGAPKRLWAKRNVRADEEMSRTSSACAGKPYAVARFCRGRRACQSARAGIVSRSARPRCGRRPFSLMVERIAPGSID